MVYDCTVNLRTPEQLRVGGPTGFSVHDNKDANGPRFEVYSDDGHGNGNHVATCGELAWALAVAHSLDYTATAGRKIRGGQ